LLSHTNPTISRPTNSLAEQTTSVSNQIDTNEPQVISDPHLAFDEVTVAAPSHTRHRGTILRGIVRPLLAVATSQYMLVLLLAILAAVTVSRQASQIITEKFLTVTQALKRL